MSLRATSLRWMTSGLLLYACGGTTDLWEDEPWPGDDQELGGSGTSGGSSAILGGKPGYGGKAIFGGYPGYGGKAIYGGYTSYAGKVGYGGRGIYGGKAAYAGYASAGKAAYAGYASAGKAPYTGGKSAYGGTSSYGGKAIFAGGTSSGGKASGGTSSGGTTASGGSPPTCIAGSTLRCVCFDGSSGAQECQPDGTYAPCRCLLTELRENLIGTWSGTRGTSWDGDHTVTMTFTADGHYSALCSDGCVVMYWGSDRDNSQKTYQIDQVNVDGVGSGWIIIWFEESDTTNRGQITDLTMTGNGDKITFSVWKDGSGPVEFKLKRL